jgi:pyrroloquinoline quinone biosynthesis protein B
MIVRVLGSAAGGGVPQWNCGCPNCARARRGEAPARTQSSFAVSPDKRTWILVNVSADVGRQLAVTPDLWPHGARASPFAAVLITDANVDHTAGLGEFRQEPDPLVVVSTRATKELLAPQLAFARFDRAPHSWRVCEDGDDVAPSLGDAIGSLLAIRVVEVPGLLPGYAGRRSAAGAVVAYEFCERATGATLLIAPVFADLDERLARAVARCDLALLDGSFYADGELAGKTARSLGHAPVSGPGGTLERVAPLGARRVFVHLNNTNPMLDPASEAHRATVEAGCEVADDGWSAEVPSKRGLPC